MLAAARQRERTGRGARIVVSMTHGRTARRAPARPAAAEAAHRRRRLLPDLRDAGRRATSPSRRSSRSSGGNLCELLDRPDLVDRAFEPELPELAGIFRRDAAPSGAPRARGQGHLCRPGADAGRGGRGVMSGHCGPAVRARGNPCRRAPRAAGRLRPAWSPDGARIAYVTGATSGPPMPTARTRPRSCGAPTSPPGRPNGRRLAFTRDGSVWTVRVDGDDERRLARGAHPAWSPNGERIAFDRDGTIVSLRWDGGGRAHRRHGQRSGVRARRPAGSRAGRRDRRRRAHRRDGSRAGLVPDGSTARLRPRRHDLRRRPRASRGEQPDWRPAARVRELLPDFDQRAADRSRIGGGPGRWLLGFTSLVDNVGLGPGCIVGVRPSGAPRMIGTQHVLLANGKSRTYRDVAPAPLHELAAAPPLASHALRLVRAPQLDGRTLVRDRKSGFCLADHYGHTRPGSWPNRSRASSATARGASPDATHVLRARRPATPTATRRSSTARTSTSPACRPGSTTSSTA